jgi:hypothetical protein
MPAWPTPHLGRAASLFQDKDLTPFPVVLAQRGDFALALHSRAWHPGRRSHRVSLRVSAAGEQAGDQNRAADIRARWCRCRACFLFPPLPWVVRHSHEPWPDRRPSGRLRPRWLRRARRRAWRPRGSCRGLYRSPRAEHISLARAADSPPPAPVAGVWAARPRPWRYASSRPARRSPRNLFI